MAVKMKKNQKGEARSHTCEIKIIKTTNFPITEPTTTPQGKKESERKSISPYYKTCEKMKDVGGKDP